LTTVSVNPLRMGQQAAQLLFKQINAGRAEIENIRTPVRLVVRQSTGRPLTAVEMESAN
jgi:LacI family transcriptional regulator